MAANGQMELPHVDAKFDIPFERSPFKLQNLKVYRRLKSVIDENQYDMIHCHTPMGGVLARLAARRARKRGTRVLYTAHGFHFCKGASYINWLMYYPIEKMLSRYTDCLITINSEDYNLAVNHRFRAERIDHVHGVGVNTERFKPVDELEKCTLRKQLGYSPDEFIMFYAAEFNKNKNQQLLIHALALLQDEVPQARLLLAGEGAHQEQCRMLASELGVAEKIEFLGYRKDISPLLSLSDIAVASSLREGLPVNIMEAMACGLPIIASINRGHSELIENAVNGYVIDAKDHRQFADRIIELSKSCELRARMGMESRNRVRQYSITQVGSELTGIYSHYFLGDGNETKGKYSGAYI